MTEAQVLIATGEAHVMKTYNRYQLVLDHGEGAYLWDVKGKKYLDMVGGIAVNSLGTNHPKLVEAIAKQAAKLIHCSNLYYTAPQIALAEKLITHSGFEKVFFCNSGAESNEAALKLCRKYATMKGKKGRRIITALHSFHGRTYAAITATAQAKYQKGLDPLMPGFQYVPYNDIAALERVMDEGVCGVLLECIQGEGGMVPATKEFLQAARSLCDKYDALLIFDEVQTGIGRTGQLFAHQVYGVQPDCATVAKGLAGGVPIGALLATEPAAQAFQPGDHASTFGGNPLATAAGCAVIDELFEHGLLAQVQQVGAYLTAQLIQLQKKYPQIIDVRGMGLMQGIELTVPVAPIVAKAMENGLLLVGAGEKVIRFVPPLIITKAQVDEAMEILQHAIENS